MNAAVINQVELFPSASERDIKRTKFLLEKYASMVSIIEDYEKHQKDLEMVAVDGEAARKIDQEDTRSDKPANAVILLEKQKWVYKTYKDVTTHIRRAWGLILDCEVKEVIRYRYLDGRTYTETLWRFEREGMSEATVKRRLNEGIETIAGSLKLWGALEEWRF